MYNNMKVVTDLIYVIVSPLKPKAARRVVVVVQQLSLDSKLLQFFLMFTCRNYSFIHSLIHIYKISVLR